jgi:phosphate transport system substrate-binding protein
MKSPCLIGLFAAVCSLHAADTLAGAGATFPAPLYEKWIAAFQAKFPGMAVTYRGIGSGAGAEALRKGEVDFAASDAPLAEEQLAAFPTRVRHIPTTVGGVVPVYHLEGSVRDLRFTPEILAGIYLGKIKRWNDPLLRAANRDAALPPREIVVVHRSDSSGTTYVWTDYLSKISAEWRSAVGVSTSVRWPVGMAAEYNEGVADLVAKTPDSIGYVEFIYALQSHLSYGAVRNASGRFVQADLSSLAAAAATFQPAQNGDLRASVTNAGGPRAYPIAAFTYFLVPERLADPAKAKIMIEFLRWALTSGQKQSASLGYVALPDPLVQQALESAGGSR